MPTETEEKIDIGAELLALSDTKTKIAEAITAKGVETSKDDNFSTYPEKIKQIQSGGGGDGGISIKSKCYSYSAVIKNSMGGLVESHASEVIEAKVKHTYQLGEITNSYTISLD